MTPKQRIQRAILLAASATGSLLISEEITEANVDVLYDSLCEKDLHWDLESEFRESGEETNIDAPYSRHYESLSKGRLLEDGTWIGWTYWYGGGKHGNPEGLLWMEDAYELKLVEEKEIVVKVRKFEELKNESSK